MLKPVMSKIKTTYQKFSFIRKLKLINVYFRHKELVKLRNAR